MSHPQRSQKTQHHLPPSLARILSFSSLRSQNTSSQHIFGAFLGLAWARLLTITWSYWHVYGIWPTCKIVKRSSHEFSSMQKNNGLLVVVKHFTKCIANMVVFKHFFLFVCTVCIKWFASWPPKEETTFRLFPKQCPSFALLVFSYGGLWPCPKCPP